MRLLIWLLFIVSLVAGWHLLTAFMFGWFCSNFWRGFLGELGRTIINGAQRGNQ